MYHQNVVHHDRQQDELKLSPTATTETFVLLSSTSAIPHISENTRK